MNRADRLTDAGKTDRFARPVRHTTTCEISLGDLNPSNWSYHGSKILHPTVDGHGLGELNPMANTGINMKIRNAGETAAVLALNYYLPGSSLLTSGLASKDSQEQLNSRYGMAAQLLTGGAGIMKGNLGNYGKLYDAGTESLGIGGGDAAATPGSSPAVAGSAPGAASTPAAAAAAPSGMTAGQAVAMSALASVYLAPKMPEIPLAPEPLTPPQASKQPDASSYLNNMTGMGQSGGQAGIAQTLLAGIGGVDPTKLKKSRTTLLGA